MKEYNPSPIVRMNAYVIMLHLRFQGWTNFTEIRKLLCWEHFYQAVAIDSVGHINYTIDRLREEWGEDIPKINAFVFTGETKCTSYICENVFCLSKDEQPSPKDISAHAAAIAAYPNWDEIVEVLRREAFEAWNENSVKS